MEDHRVCKRCDKVDIEKIIVVTLLRGAGTPDDPVRYVRQYWDMNSKYLFEIDEINESEG